MGVAKLKIPAEGEKIVWRDGELRAPDNPIIPFIEGDGTGADITPVMKRVVDAAVETLYAGRRHLHWMKLPVGEAALKEFGSSLPEEALQAIRDYRVAIKGPLTTPVGEGHRSLNVAIRQALDLYACVRPVKWIRGLPSPVLRPEDLDIVIFRENTEDIYLGVEYAAESDAARRFIDLVHETQGVQLAPESAIGIKPMSRHATERISEAAIRHAIAMKRPSITIVHKGNIQKYTEGAFRNWAYDYFTRVYRDLVVKETEIIAERRPTEGKIVIKDRIADSMFQQLLLRPAEYSVILTTNLNGDYLSDAGAAQIGGLGMAPGGNVGDGVGVFEATHGSAPKYAGQDKVNPGSLLLSACMMLDYMGWTEAATAIREAIGETIKQRRVTYDLERLMPGSTLVSCSGFGQAIIENLRKA
ncbi:MAG: isocitrate dehydrogenase (NADP(+)) [Myxococcales bacterium]|nr:MAG: isocitrate dehydrogenase (NADP(+)) [Myxococcales bacterium]